MRITNLAFIMTDRCSAACAACCFSCTPQGSKLLSWQMMKDYIDEACEVGTFESISFTGGEAILHYEQLLDCVSYAAQRGLETTLITNGFWAKDVQKGTTMLKTLSEAGLTRMSLSLDKFHQEYVPYSTAVNAIEILRKLDIPFAIPVMDTTDGSGLREMTQQIQESLYYNTIRVHPIFPVGGAANIPPRQILRVINLEDAVCPFDRSISVLFDGTMMMCCSQFSHKIEMTWLGQFGKTPLREAIAVFDRNDFLYLLIKNGFQWFADMAKSYGISLKKAYSSSCELCYELFGNDEFVEFVRPLAEDEANRLRIEKLMGEW